MDDKQLAKKFHDKKFLKSNEFINLVAKFFSILKEYKMIVILAGIVLLIIGVTIPALKWYRLKEVQSFNKKLYSAQTSIKKEAAYRGLITDYKNLQASQFARLKLIDDLMDHQQVDEARQVIENGLQGDDRNIFTTLLVLKNINIFKENNKYKEAAAFAKNNENKILETFLGQYQLIYADLLLLDNNRSEARKVYEKLSQFSGIGAEGQKQLVDFDPVVANKAKDKLLLLDLGIL